MPRTRLLALGLAGVAAGSAVTLVGPAQAAEAATGGPRLAIVAPGTGHPTGRDNPPGQSSTALSASGSPVDPWMLGLTALTLTGGLTMVATSGRPVRRRVSGR